MKKNRSGMKLFLLVSLIVMLGCGLTFGQTGSRFLLLDVGAREIGMAGIPSNGVNSLFYNPAILAHKDHLEFGLMHAEWLQSIRYETFGVTQPLENFGSFGFGAMLLYVTDLEFTEDSVRPQTTFSCYDFSLLGSLSKRFNNKISVGLNLKGIYRKIYDRTSVGACTDVGFMVIPIEWFNVNLALQNLGPPMGFENKNTKLPLTFRTGLGFTLLNNTTRCGLDLVKVIDEDFEVRFGVEYLIAQVLGIRGGYKSGYNDAGSLAGLATGLGVKFREFGVDYSFNPYGDLGNTHRMSLTYTRGEEKEQEETLVKLMMDELKKKEKMMSESFYKRGLDYLGRKEYDDAIDAFDKALTWDPEYADAQIKLDEAKRLKTEKTINQYVSRGVSFYNSGDMVNALYEFNQALTLAPQNQELVNWVNRINTALVKKEPEAIMKHFQKGISYYGKGEYKKAIDEWQAVLAINPNHQESQDYILRAQRKISESITKWLAEAQNYFNRKEWDQALSAVNKVLKFEPNNSFALDIKKKIVDNLKQQLSQTLQEAIRFYNEKNYSLAEENFRLVLSWDPKNKTALEYLKKIKPTVKYDKKYLADLYLKGINAYTNNDFKSALIYWNKIAEIDPDYQNIAKNIDRAKKRLAEYK